MRAQIHRKGCVNVKLNRKEVTFLRGGGRMGWPSLSPPGISPYECSDTVLEIIPKD